MQVDQYETALDTGISQRVMAMRLLVGLLQGALLYWLYRAGKDGDWPATAPYVITPLLMIGLMLPALVITSMGHMAAKKAAWWALAAAVILLLLSLHDTWRGAGQDGLDSVFYERPSPHMPSWRLLQFGGAFLYIAHALVMAAALDRRRIAAYGSYFEMAWKLAVQLVFSVFFVGVLWLVLWMGAELFLMVKLNFLQELLGKAWFAMPVICFAWSCAMHVTDVRPSIVRGIRTLLLVLSSWILPVAALIVCGFLCTLPFTGLTALWSTRHATSLLLTADAVLIVLINAAFQNGEAKAALAIRISARTAANLLLPLTAIAIYALGLRVYDYGWTTDRVVAAACLVVASCYAVGYVWAAQSYSTWLCPIAKVNVATAFVVLAVLLALFTPVADPARLSVDNQMARLANGRIQAEKFDYRYLRFEGRRYGQAALEQLTHAENKLVSDKALAALKMKDRWIDNRNSATAVTIAENIKVWPVPAQLPAGFIAQKWSELPASERPSCLGNADQKCEAWVMDLDGDGKPEVLLFGRYPAAPGMLFSETPDGKWIQVGSLFMGSCSVPLRDALKAGHFTLAAPRWKTLEVGGRQLSFTPEWRAEGCKAIEGAK